MAISGFHGLTVLRSTASGTVDSQDEYPTLAETEDRILGTEIATRWCDNTADAYASAAHDGDHCCPMPAARMPAARGRSQHLAVDESRRRGLHQLNEVLCAAERPYGLIEATVLRPDNSTADAAWVRIVGSC